MTEGESARLTVKLENVSGKGQGMAVAVIGLPAGLKLPEDFKQLKDLAPDAKIDLAVDLQGAVPGEYRGPASRAYLYYTDEFKHWAAGVSVTVKTALTVLAPSAMVALPMRSAAAPMLAAIR